MYGLSRILTAIVVSPAGVSAISNTSATTNHAARQVLQVGCVRFLFCCWTLPARLAEDDKPGLAGKAAGIPGYKFLVEENYCRSLRAMRCNKANTRLCWPCQSLRSVQYFRTEYSIASGCCIDRKARRARGCRAFLCLCLLCLWDM